MSKWWWGMGVVIVFGSFYLYKKYVQELQDIHIVFELPDCFIGS